MKKPNILNSLTLIGILIYNILFWQEKMGINVLLFTLYIIGSLFWINPESIKSKPAIRTAIGTLFLSVMIVINNAAFAKVLYLISTTSMVGFVHFKSLRLIWHAFTISIVGIFEVPQKMIKEITFVSPSMGNGFRMFRLTLIPALIIPVFYVIYYIANPHFAELSSRFWENAFNLLFNFSIERVLFFLSSVFIVGGIIWKPIVNYFDGIQANKNIQLKRVRNIHNKDFTKPANIMGLKDEYRIGVTLMVLLNLLLLTVNTIDFKYVWFGFDENEKINLSSYVHEGTYLLILAILLAMAVLLYFFRKNLNFFKENKVLKVLAYLWILQNVILCSSVALRNYRYIDFQGLAYKRIGVAIFLLLVFNGLWTLYMKIRKKRSLYYLFLYNSWAVYVVLTLTTLVNWDCFITHYNITSNTKGNIDTAYLLTVVSDKNIYLLKEYEENLKAQKTFPKLAATQFDNLLQQKIKSFLQVQKKVSWLSWNYPDYRNKKFLEK